MQDKPGKKDRGRRDFLKSVSLGGTMAFIPLNILNITDSRPEPAPQKSALREKYAAEKRKYNTTYTGEFLNRIAFPIGGLGAGMFCLEGTGAVSQVSVRNQPDMFNDPGMFAAISVKGIENGAKLLEGPVPDWKKFGLHDAGNGLGGSTTGLPHFHSCTALKPSSRFAISILTDNDIPLSVEITGWSPFIPTDDDNSSLPVGAIEYHFTNTGKSAVDAVFSFNAKNFLKIENGKNA